VTWDDVAITGAFVLGAILGAGVVLRLTRYLLEYLRRRD
jgi:hypothetical protein